tara:strand:- start:490 stop:693 length:204 start_codon:yes stop_codon:yes gene_type:complete
MKAGQLVKWSSIWLGGCTNKTREDTIEHYRDQIGILIERLDDPTNCWAVAWNDGKTSEVHREFLEVL